VCRHLAFVSAVPQPLHALLVGAPHSLVDQARAPRLQTWGDDNPDGWGVGWFDDQGRIQRYRTAAPIWDDPEVEQLAATVTTRAALAAVRLASPGATVTAAGTAPFTADGRWLFSLNGSVEGFYDGVGDELRKLASPRRLAAVESDADTEVLFALVLDFLDAGASPADALRHVIDLVEERTTGRLNLLLTDGHVLVASAWGSSLFRASSLLASEPLADDPTWQPVPDRSVLTLDAATHPAFRHVFVRSANENVPKTR